jgi:hypothetical protein
MLRLSIEAFNIFLQARAVIHLLVLVLLTSFFDMVVLDWFIISKVTPEFVVIPGSDVEDY